MAPPAAFYTVSSFPYSQVVTASDFNTGAHGGAANEVWFKYAAPGAIAFGMFVDDTAGAFNWRMDFYESDSLTVRGHSINSGWFQEIATITNYWVKVTKSGGGAIAAPITVQFDTRSMSPTIEPGDYLINDDTGGFAAAVISTDGTVKGYANTVPGGEMLVGTLSGYVLAHDRFSLYGSPLALLSPALTLVSSFDLSPAVSGFPRLATAGDTFYVLNPANRNVYSVTTAGVATLLASAIDASTPNAIGVSPDGSILYYVLPTEHKIRRYNLSTPGVLSDLYTLTDASGDTIQMAVTAINGHPGEIVVQPDGSVVTYYQNYTQNKSVAIRVSSAGMLLGSNTYNVNPSTVGGIDHISQPGNVSGRINIWRFTNADNEGTIENLTLGSGVSVTAVLPLFSSEVNRFTKTTSTAMFGPSSSCGFTTLLASESSGGSGSTDIPQANSSECCASNGTEGGGNPEPGAGVSNPVQANGFTWTPRVTGGGEVPQVPDLTDAEDWSNS